MMNKLRYHVLVFLILALPAIAFAGLGNERFLWVEYNVLVDWGDYNFDGATVVSPVFGITDNGSTHIF